MMKNIFVLIGFAVFAAPVPAVRADVLTLTNGKSMKGLVEDDKENPRHVHFIGARGRQAIPRGRVKSIEQEPLAVGHLHIGDEYRKMGRLDDALGSYRQAVSLDPGLEAAAEKVKATEAAIERRKRSQRQDDIQEIERLKVEIARIIRVQDFAGTEAMLEKASGLQPTPQQKKELQALVADLYLAWAEERLDKYDKPGAEQKLNLALAAEPKNDGVIELLLTIWENDPDKREQTIRIYETVLERKPEDEVLRRKLGDLYFAGGNFDDAILHYLKVYNASERYKGTGLEGRVVATLERLHLQHAVKKDYDQAILFFNMLAAIDASAADPIVRLHYRYLKMAREVVSGDVMGRLKLAAFCDENQLEALALQNYRLILTANPESEVALAAIHRYAMIVVAEARGNYDKKDYYMAKTLATRAVTDYPESAGARLEAREILGKADIQIQRDQRQKADLAKDYISRGDQCYQDAITFYRDISDTTRRGTALLSTPKADAISHFKCAIDAYETALRINPALREQPGSLVARNLALAKGYMQRLSAGPPQLGFDQSKRPLR